MRSGDISFRVAADFTVVEELTARRGERVGDRDVDIIVMLRRHDLVPWNRDDEANFELRTCLLMMMGLIDPHVAVLDPVVDVIEPLEPASDIGCHAGAM